MFNGRSVVGGERNILFYLKKRLFRPLRPLQIYLGSVVIVFNLFACHCSAKELKVAYHFNGLYKCIIVCGQALLLHVEGLRFR